MWKVIKFFNKRLNEMLCVQIKFMIWLGCFPRLTGLPSAEIKSLNECGSAPPESGNAFCATHAAAGVKASIVTYRKFVTGRGWFGEEVERDWVSGMLSYKDIDTKGRWRIAVEFDKLSRANWEAVWFLADGKSKRYREVDIERCNTENNQEILISVHDGATSEINRRLYNHSYPIPDFNVEFTFKLRPFTRVYINGVLAFIGLQWKMPKKASLIISSGVLPDKVNTAVAGVFKVHGITHKR